MSEKELQSVLAKIAKLSIKAKAMAKELYGPEAFIFVEPEGGIYAMDGDAGRAALASSGDTEQ